MCPVMLRAGLASVTMLLPALCFAQTPNAPIEPIDERTKAQTAEGNAALTAGETAAETIATPAPATAPAVSLNIIDQKLALSLAVDTWGQIAANERALESATGQAVRELIAHRLETQRGFAALLDVLTDGRTSAAIEDARREIAADAASTKTKVVRFRPLALHKNATAMMVRIRMEILDGYLADVEEGLATRSGQEFDCHFLRGDLMHQMQLLAMLEVFERQASADFAGVLQQEVVAAREHLARTQQMLVQLEAPALPDSIAVPTASVPLEQR